MDDALEGRLTALRTVLAMWLRKDAAASTMVAELIDAAEVLGGGETDEGVIMRLAAFHSELETLLDLTRKDDGADPAHRGRTD